VLVAARDVLSKRRDTRDPEEKQTASSECSGGDNSKSDPSATALPSPKPRGILKQTPNASSVEDSDEHTILTVDPLSTTTTTAIPPQKKTVRWAC